MFQYGERYVMNKDKNIFDIKISRLERMNWWCRDFMDNLCRYDDLITFSFFAFMIGIVIFCFVISILGMTGVIK